jgi:methyl-accepting chemotaxis protein
VAGVVAFLVKQELELSETRRDLLRNVAVLLSSSFERMAQVEQMRELAASAEGVNQVLRRVNTATTSHDAVRTAVESVRDAFGGTYAAYWAKNPDGSIMGFAAESGDITHAFRATTANAHYVRGVGVVGRAWLERDLVVVADIAREEGELRRASALEAGLRAGACFPVTMKDRVVGAIEVWFREKTPLSSARIHALRSVMSAISSTLERLTERDGFAASLEDFASELLAVSSSLRATTAEQSASAQELASAIGEVTATLSELRETSGEALRNAEAVIYKAEGALATSTSGRGSVERAIESMRVIREQVSEIAERILQLNDQTSQIGSIIATVNEISAQSKLLALNAAIEAARAGEHGKGFGVVATEIRSLAEQSKEATGQVREILSEIQASTNAAVVAAEEGTKKSESGMALADTSGERISELARSMEESSSSARLIANSARQQSAGIEQVAQALISISNATNDTASGLKQTEQATQQLVTLAERMASIVRGVAARKPSSSARPSNQNAAE